MIVLKQTCVGKYWSSLFSLKTFHAFGKSLRVTWKTTVSTSFCLPAWSFTLCIFKAIILSADGYHSNSKMVSEGIKHLFIFGCILMLWFMCRVFLGRERAGCVSAAVRVLAKLQELQSEAPSASRLFPSKPPASISDFAPGL